jgi:hypothetical protein
VTYLGTSPDGANRSGRVDRSVGAGRSVGRVKITTSLNRIAQPLRPTRPAPTLPTDPQSLPTTPQTRERVTCVECRQVHYDRPPAEAEAHHPATAGALCRARLLGRVGRSGSGRSGSVGRTTPAGRLKRVGRSVFRVPPTLRQGLSVALRYEPNQFA